jgi:hypothetical protein
MLIHVKVYQTEIFYFTTPSKTTTMVTEISADPSNGEPSSGSLNPLQYTANPSGRLAGFWPSIFYPAPGGNIAEIRYDLERTNNIKGWNSLPTQFSCLANSTIVALPLRSDFLNSGMTLLYQDEDGTMSSLIRNTTDNWTTGESPSFCPLVSCVDDIE